MASLLTFVLLKILIKLFKKAFPHYFKSDMEMQCRIINKNNMKKIILDTNFLMIPSQFNVDIFSEIDRIIKDKYELYVLKGTLDELNKIMKKKKKGKRAARLALQLIKAKGLKILNINQKSVDKTLIKLSKEYIIATQDMELKRKLKKKIILRKKQYLELKNVL